MSRARLRSIDRDVATSRARTNERTNEDTRAVLARRLTSFRQTTPLAVFVVTNRRASSFPRLENRGCVSTRSCEGVNYVGVVFLYLVTSHDS